MKRRRLLLGLGTATGGSGLLVGSGAFTTGRTDRELTVDVVGDEEAYLMLRYGTVERTDVPSAVHEDVELVTVGNHFDTEIEIDRLDLEVADEDFVVTDLDHPESLDVGELGVVTVDVRCRETGIHATTVRFGVTATGDDVYVETTRDREVEVTVSCRTQKCVDLLAGQHTPVGEVCVVNDHRDLTVTYSTPGNWKLSETHLAVGDDLAQYREEGWVNAEGLPRPGHFPETGTHEPDVESVTHTIPLEELGAAAGDELLVAAHAVVERKRDDDREEETAWADGEEFAEPGWASSVHYTVR